MSSISRREAREHAFQLLFEAEFQPQKTLEEVYNLAAEDRDISSDAYIKEAFFGVKSNQGEIDAFISKHSKGWTVDRIAPVTRSILRLAIYEIKFRDDIPVRVAINEAIELAKQYDDEKARPFINGILNSVKETLEQHG